MLFYLWRGGEIYLTPPRRASIFWSPTSKPVLVPPVLGKTRDPQSGPFSATTLLRGAAGEMVFLVVRNSQEGEGRFHRDLEGWVRLSLTVVGYGSSGRAEHEPA